MAVDHVADTAALPARHESHAPLLYAFALARAQRSRSLAHGRVDVAAVGLVLAGGRLEHGEGLAVECADMGCRGTSHEDQCPVDLVHAYVTAVLLVEGVQLGQRAHDADVVPESHGGEGRFRRLFPVWLR